MWPRHLHSAPLGTNHMTLEPVMTNHDLSLVAVSGGYSSLRCTGFSLWWLLLLQSMGSRPMGSAVVARGLSSCGSWALECTGSVVVAHGL